MRDAPIENCQFLAVDECCRRIHVAEHGGDFFDGLAVHRTGVGLPAGHSGGWILENRDVAVGGESV
jgi:hypothetical protein